MSRRWAILLVVSACYPADGQILDDAEDAGETAPDAGTSPDATPDARCPDDMEEAAGVCMDRLEAPNVAGARPLVMYSFLEAEAWCGARGKRLCYDDEWTRACAGPSGWKYPYGDTRVPGRCNDDKEWRLYDQLLLNGWPANASRPDVTSLDELLADVRRSSPGTAGHVEWLYQGTGGGDRAGCVGPDGVLDLQGNVEEWTRRRDGGATDFHGNLKGRYWAEPRTCQGNVTVHGDAFRFYEIGFRCCR